MGTVLVVDDHPLMLNGLRILIGSLELGLQVETSHTAEVGLSKARKFSDLRLIILDLNLPTLSGIPAVSSFKKHFPATPLIVLSGSEDRRSIDAAMRSGASAFVSKASSPEELRRTIAGVLHGEPSALAPLLGPVVGDGDCPVGDLTGRQREVLHFLMKGLSNKEIALRLDVAEITVKTHVKAIMRRLGVANRTQIVIEAQRLGLEPVAEATVGRDLSR